MIVFVYKELTRNAEIENTPEFYPVSGDWVELGA